MNWTDAKFRIYELFNAQEISYADAIEGETPDRLYSELTNLYGDLGFTVDQLARYMDENPA